jgi:L-threonylcarbamoyladenylate synthase
VPHVLTAGQPKICVRCTACPIARGLCQAFGGALTSSSANLSGHPPARSLEEIAIPDVALGIDGGILPPSVPSTVFDPDEVRIIREGCIPADVLLKFSASAG